MRPINLRSNVTALFVALASVVFCSFAPVPGGASYEVYLNNELVIREYLHGTREVPNVPLNINNVEDELSLTFNNCGRIDTSRKISLKTGQDETLKEWTFADSPDLKNQMKIKVSDIAAFRNKNSPIKLVYSSREFGSSVDLVNLQLSDATALKK